MNKQAVREMLAQVVAELAENEKEHQLLMNVKEAYEALLGLRPDRGVPTRPHLVTDKKLLYAFLLPTGRLVEVLRRAGGVPLHVQEILNRVQVARIEVTGEHLAHRLTRQLYATMRSYKQLQRVGPSTWRWVETIEAAKV